MKRTLDKSKGKWLDLLPSVMWAYRATSHLAIEKSPFVLAFGVKVLVLPKLNVLSTCVSNISMKWNLQMATMELDYLEEKRRDALLWLKNYQSKATHHYNSSVCPKTFMLGKLVFQKFF